MDCGVLSIYGVVKRCWLVICCLLVLSLLRVLMNLFVGCCLWLLNGFFLSWWCLIGLLMVLMLILVFLLNNLLVIVCKMVLLCCLGMRFVIFCGNLMVVGWLLCVIVGLVKSVS